MRFYDNEEELFEDIKTGEPDAFEYVFRTYYPRLRNLARRFIDNDDDLEDILQNCFIRLWEHHTKLSSASIPALLYTITRNSCLNFLKHQATINNRKIIKTSDAIGIEELYSLDMKGTPEQETIYHELASQIDLTMEELTPRCREIFTLSRIEGLKNREIAERLGVSVKVVEKHISHAIAIFRKELKSGKISAFLLFWLLDA